MFNLSGSEMVFLLLIALVILGPDKLPDALRRAGKAYAEFKKVTTGFQTELKNALDEPMREMRETADLVKKSVTDASTLPTTATPEAPTPPAAAADAPPERLNFGGPPLAADPFGAMPPSTDDETGPR